MASLMGGADSCTSWCVSVPQSQRRASSDATVAGASPPAKKAAVESSVSPPLRVPSMATSRTDQADSAEELCIAAMTETEPNIASEVTADGNWAMTVSNPADFVVTATSLAAARQELKGLMGDVKNMRYDTCQVLRVKVSVIPHGSDSFFVCF